MNTTYAELVAKDTSVNGEHEYEGPGPEGSPSENAAADRAALTMRPDEANADALRIYPRGRYEAARDGRTSLREFARDLVAHVNAQLPGAGGPPVSPAH